MAVAGGSWQRRLGACAVVAFSESLFYEVEDQSVLVTAVNPGFVRT